MYACRVLVVPAVHGCPVAALACLGLHHPRGVFVPYTLYLITAAACTRQVLARPYTSQAILQGAGAASVCKIHSNKSMCRVNTVTTLYLHAPPPLSVSEER